MNHNAMKHTASTINENNILHDIPQQTILLVLCMMHESNM